MAALSQTSTAFIPSVDARHTNQEYVCGASVAAGQPCYIDASNLIQLCDSNASALAGGCIGFADRTAAAGQRARLVISDPNLVLGSTLVIGDTIWTHTTAGAITKTAADNTTGVYTCFLGVAKSTTVLNFIGPCAAGAITP